MKSKIGEQIETRPGPQILATNKCLFNVIISQNTNTQGPKSEKKIVISKFVLRVEYVHNRGWAAYYSDIDECIILYEMIFRQ